MNRIVYCSAVHRFDAERLRIAVEGLRICEGCRSGIVRDLRVIPGLWKDLHSGVATSLVGGLSRTDPLVSGTRARGIVYDAPALNCAEQMSRDLAYFARWILGQPGCSVPVAASRLLQESDRVAGHELAPMVREVCRSLVISAYKILDPKGRPVEVGPCPEYLDTEEYIGRCTGTLYMRGEGKRAALSCHVCEVVVPQRSWYRYAKRYAEAMAEVVDVKGDLL